MFGSKPLDYKLGDGTLPKLKPSKYFVHHLPGEPTLTQMDLTLLSEEAKSGKHELLINKVVNFSISLEYTEGDYIYCSSSSTLPTPLANNKDRYQGNKTDEAMAFLANVVRQKINNEIKLYIELLPYLEKFEEKLRTELSLEQRRFFMCIFRVGMGLSLIENLSGLNIQGFCHPSISNILHSPQQVLESLIRHGFSWDLDFVGTNESQMRIVKLALYIGYFQSKYTAESPSSIMEFVAPIE